MENLDLLIKELVKQPKETSWLEFKLNNDEPGMIGEDICALANSAALAGRDKAYFIWGVENETHDLKGTSFNWRTAKVGNEELENWLHHNLSANANFEFDSTQIGGGMVRRSGNHVSGGQYGHVQKGRVYPDRELHEKIERLSGSEEGIVEQAPLPGL